MSQRFDVTYTNYKGITSRRIFIGHEIKWGANEWHPEPQWLIYGFDLERKVWRDFALKDMKPYTKEENES